MRKHIIAAALACAAVLAGASPAQAQTQRYSLTMNVKTSYTYTASWKGPVQCADEVRHTADGAGGGGMQLRGIGLPISIKFIGRSRIEPLVERSRGTVPLTGKVSRAASYSVGREGTPEEAGPFCDRMPPPIETDTCGTKRRQTLELMLLFDRAGRLLPLGGLKRNPYGSRCPDQTGLSASLGRAIRSPRGARADIKNLKVDRTWRHEDEHKVSFAGGKNLSFPGNEDFKTGSGRGTITWSIKLKRIR